MVKYLIREHIEKLQAGEDIRKNLIGLKAECKDFAGKHGVLYALNNDLQMFYGFLKAEDPKIRKNAALILGQLGEQSSLEPLYQAYETEETLFVKSSYLTAMKELDFRKYLEAFKNRLQELMETEAEESAKKHVQEERKILQEMILMMEGSKKHTFTGWNVPSRVILLTNRNFRELTKDQLPTERCKVFNAGVQAYCEDLKQLFEIRTFSELLFVLEDCPSIAVNNGENMDKIAEQVAQKLCDSTLLSFLQKRHAGEGPYYFRIECKNKMDLKQKSGFTKKLAAYLEEKSACALLNSTSHYEVELRLIENKTGGFNVLLKLYTIEDTRFAYRKEVLSSSIQPVNAALAIRLAAPYLKKGAQVLDPFCGVGTMLIERNRYEETGDLYGIDLYGVGIDAARENAKLAGIRVNYINRDFFDFKHDYLFDEVISNMPRVMGQKTAKEIQELYKKFWKKIQEHIGHGAILVLYCYDKDIFQATILYERFRVLEEFEISKKEGSYVFVIRYE